MRCALILVVIAGLWGKIGFCDEGESVPSDPRVNRSDDSIPALAKAIEAIEKRLSEFDRQIQRQGQNAQQIPKSSSAIPYPPAPLPGASARHYLAPAAGQFGTYRWIEAAPTPLPSVQPSSASSPTPNGQAAASKPRVAQETDSWQRIEIDGKVYYIVPASDVLQIPINKHFPTSYGSR